MCTLRTTSFGRNVAANSCRERSTLSLVPSAARVDVLSALMRNAICVDETITKAPVNTARTSVKKATGSENARCQNPSRGSRLLVSVLVRLSGAACVTCCGGASDDARICWPHPSKSHPATSGIMRISIPGWVCLSVRQMVVVPFSAGGFSLRYFHVGFSMLYANPSSRLPTLEAW